MLDPNHTPYKTIVADTHAELPPIKGSRFIAYAFPVVNDEEVDAYLQHVRSRYPDARHWCFAYQLRAARKTRFSDDGEPAGSAGKPILAPIVGRALYDVLVVVVRYFGGVKLGVGGLVRAYSDAANAVLNAAEIIEVTPKIDLFVQFGYEQTAQVNRALFELGLMLEDIHYTDIVQARIAVLPQDLVRTQTLLTDYTAGKIIIKQA